MKKFFDIPPLRRMVGWSFLLSTVMIPFALRNPEGEPYSYSTAAVISIVLGSLIYAIGFAFGSIWGCDLLRSAANEEIKKEKERLQGQYDEFIKQGKQEVADFKRDQAAIIRGQNKKIAQLQQLVDEGDEWKRRGGA